MNERFEQDQNIDFKAEKEEHKLENNIGSFSEIINMGTKAKFPMSSENVYRSVQGDIAINDIFESGIVRNAKSQGLSGKGRDNQVYWTRGEDNKEMGVGINRRIIEAPLKVAEQRIVTKEDVTAIYELSENQEVKDSLPERKAQIETKQKENAEIKDSEKQQRAEQDLLQIEQIRSQLNITKSESES
jgi:hypothetical protein